MTLLAAFALTGCGGGGSSGSAPPQPPVPAPPQPLADRFVVDGRGDFGVFDATEDLTISVRDAFGAGNAVRSVVLTLAAMNDDRDVYLLVRWDDPTQSNTLDTSGGPGRFDGISIVFDVDGDGVPSPGEDRRTLIAASETSQYVDEHLLTPTTATTDGIGDGQGRLRYDPATAKYTAEFLLPLADDANGEDGPLTSATRFNIELLDDFDTSAQPATGNLGRLHDAADSSNWNALALAATEPLVRPALPGNLTGLIAFLAEGDNPQRDIYTFDPATRVVSRITNMPALFKDTLALSHDRTRIAFLGAPSRDDFAAYEIYVINVDGTGLERLTTNALLDGHPAFSPDDGRIVYASFRDGGRASLIVMDVNGNEIADLTPPGSDDNDPDFLPDGRIVFKTDRFSPAPALRIAAMNADGTAVMQLSDNGGADHDPIGNDRIVVFERFLKGTDFSTDPSFAFLPWDLVEVPVTGGSERTLLSDGWVNFLPVPDPTGAYVAYIKSVGYSEVRLRSLDGTDFGRLIPDHTDIVYFDWK